MEEVIITSPKGDHHVRIGSLDDPDYIPYPYDISAIDLRCQNLGILISVDDEWFYKYGRPILLTEEEYGRFMNLQLGIYDRGEVVNDLTPFKPKEGISDALAFAFKGSYARRRTGNSCYLAR